MFSVRMRSERVYHLIKVISLANMAEVISSEVLLLLQQLVAEAETRPSQCHGHITVHLNPPSPGCCPWSPIWVTSLGLDGSSSSSTFQPQSSAPCQKLVRDTYLLAWNSENGWKTRNPRMLAAVGRLVCTSWNLKLKEREGALNNLETMAASFVKLK